MAGSCDLSVHLPKLDEFLQTEPVASSDLLDYFYAGAKPRAAWRVGAEFEKFAIERRTGRHLTYGEPGGICSILNSLVERFHWEPHFEGEHLTTLSRAGSMISLEPGGQIEFSTAPLQTISELNSALENHRHEIRAVTDSDSVAWIASGVSPFQSADDIALGVRPRHRLMAEYLPSRCPMALPMMKATASTQVTFDYACEADAMRKFQVALKLSPIINAIWANSSHYAGRSTGFASYRSQIWLGMDPDRSGLLTDFLNSGPSFEQWVQYLLAVPMLFVNHHGQYRAADGMTFQEFILHGHDGRFPTIADWEMHITTVFPEVRLKQFLEVRGADANGPALALAVPAFWKGLLYDDESLTEAAELCEGFLPDELPALFAQTSRTGLATPFAGTTILNVAILCVDMAARGLARQGEPDAVRYLDPVLEILRTGLSPGSKMRSQTLSHSELVHAFEY